MANKWREVWERRDIDKDILSSGDYKNVYLALKIMNGFDSVKELSGGVGYDAFYEQYVEIKRELEFSAAAEGKKPESIFEVGCGSGASLYLFQRDGLSVGGIDYSKAGIEISAKILQNPRELIYDEAVNLSSEVKYDMVLSNSVFSYFKDYGYASRVLEIMYEKANKSIGIIDIHDISRKEAFVAYRKKTSEDYEERYQDLPKLFYDRTFFLDFAVKHGMDIKFRQSKVKGYWNNDFVFNCFMWKRS